MAGKLKSLFLLFGICGSAFAEKSSEVGYLNEKELVGKVVVVKPEGFAGVKMSKSPDSWFKEDMVHELKPDTKVTVLEVRVYKAGSSNPLRRFKIKTADGKVGWLSLLDLLCTSAMCDAGHPQREFPFKLK